MTPKAVTKQEFGRRLLARLIEKGWNQSDLARATGIGKDSISGYIRGRSFPRPDKVHTICSALEIPEGMLLHNPRRAGQDEELAPIDIGEGRRVQLRINRWVSLATASRIMAELGEDDKESAGEAQSGGN